VGVYSLEAQNAGLFSAFGDYSGPVSYGVHITNNATFYSNADTIGNNLTGGMLIDSGSASLVNGNLNTCIASGCKLLTINSSALGASISGGTTFSNAAVAIEYDAGTYLQVTGASIGVT